ncbi:MAG: hypothetical protein HOV92_00545 [Streptomyces sp.]|nr:hypothetical protein [Streptomyces sp.]
MTEYADIVFTRHQGQAITVDGPAPKHSRIQLQALMDRYAYLHMPDPQTIVFADQVVYKVTGYTDGALELELVEDWRPAPAVQQPLTDEEAEEIKTRWKEKHGSGQAIQPVTVLNDSGPQPGPS